MTSVGQPDAPELPADAAALRALVMAMMAEREALTAERDALQMQNERLAHLLLKLRRLQFGRKAERLPEEQLQLGLEDLEQAIAQEEAQAEKRDPTLHEARCRRICHGSRSRWRRRTPPARAAGRP
jgi:transposase